MKNKNIIIILSGTGGHIYPGIAIAEEFKNSGYDVIFFVANNQITSKILENSKFAHIKFNMSGIPKKKVCALLIFLIKAKFSLLKALKYILKLNPIAIIGMGGYMSVPVIFAAKILNKKTFIHEQNVIFGKSNKLLNKIVDKTFVSFNNYKKNYRNIFVSGCPIRKSLLLAINKKSILKSEQKTKIFTILVFGGSLGSTVLNKIACETLLSLNICNKLCVLHITGPNDYIKIKDKIIKKTNDYVIFDYMHNIYNAYIKSDIVICRSGASTVFELKALNKPAILIPYPYATNNHQYLNAKEIEKSNHVIIIEEKNLTKKKLKEAIHVLKKNINDNNQFSKTKKNILEKNLPQRLIVNEIIKTIDTNNSKLKNKRQY
ncbi:MAG: undecaprenyldiphospho-muramoylpentapeptide beta-N-acetylglucosaminyltransferase [Endomicrobium sp.]|jgi:UDP-N-acetylglucosamine--N-acetylmuramyl-(pentapeptide) pyrophosphoryl-undecaprenol N-acetylglucosamine transferase|nr:undecaprenyldiphospho-muramoylpentapeptide beta-N-acetylglucosaminyltransferase [Endomicrobium sp.]